MVGFYYNPLDLLGIDVLSLHLEDMLYYFSLLLSLLVPTLIYEMRSKKTKNV